MEKSASRLSRSVIKPRMSACTALVLEGCLQVKGVYCSISLLHQLTSLINHILYVVCWAYCAAICRVVLQFLPVLATMFAANCNINDRRALATLFLSVSRSHIAHAASEGCVITGLSMCKLDAMLDQETPLNTTEERMLLRRAVSCCMLKSANC